MSFAVIREKPYTTIAISTAKNRMNCAVAAHLITNNNSRCQRRHRQKLHEIHISIDEIHIHIERRTRLPIKQARTKCAKVNEWLVCVVHIFRGHWLLDNLLNIECTHGVYAMNIIYHTSIRAHKLNAVPRDKQCERKPFRMV